MIEIIDDKIIKKNNNIYNLNIGNKKTKEVITINPFRTEHYNDIDLFNIKIFCDKNNIKLRILSTMNYLPVNSQYADELVIVENKSHMQKAYDFYDNAVTTLGAETFDVDNISGYFEVRFYQVGSNPLDRNCYDKTGIIERIYSEVSLEELINFINNKKVFIRKSSLEIFNQLDLPKNILLSEIKPTFKKLLQSLNKKNIYGLDYAFQKEILKKSGHHYMAIQILSSQHLNWKILAGGGSARLFSMLPTKNRLLMARDLYGNDHKIKPKKVGWISKQTFPWTGNQISPSWTLNEEELDEITSEDIDL